MSMFSNYKLYETHIGSSSESVKEDVPIVIDPIPATNKPPVEPNKKEAGDVVINQYDPNKKAPEKDNFTENYINWHPIFRQVVIEHFDYTDPKTNNWLMAINEDGQNSLLVGLTNKLYQMIVNKIDHIDYDEIPNTKGNIEKLSRYKNLRECFKILRNIFKQYHEDDEPIDVIEDACDNILNMKDIFMAAFMAKSALPMSVYKTMTLAVIDATSFMIAVCIEYIKNPKTDGLSIVLKKTGIARVKEHMVYETLKDFNEACRKGDVENALRPFVQSKYKGLIGAVFGVKTILILGGVLLALLPLLKDLVYFFYATKARLSTYFDIQAKLIEMNANDLKNDPDIKTQGDKESVIKRQMTIANVFYKLSNMLAVDDKAAEVKATNEIKRDKGKYKLDEVDTANPNGPLF